MSQIEQMYITMVLASFGAFALVLSLTDFMTRSARNKSAPGPSTKPRSSALRGFCLSAAYSAATACG